MNSSSYVKIASQQNANFTNTNNRIDFIIPASYGKVSLKDSFVQLYVKAEGVEADPTTGTGVYLTSLRWNDNAGVARNNYFNNVSVVRNAQISSSNKGNIESVRRVDILRQNLDSMTRSQTTVDSDRYITGDSLKNLKNEQQYSIFQDVQKLGSVPSVNNPNVPLMIRLGDILNSCNADTVDFMAMGDTRIHLELNINNVNGYQVYPQILNNGQKVNNIPAPAVAQAISSLTTTPEYTNLNQSPWYVGQKLTYTGNVNGAIGTSQRAVITSILENVDGSLVLNFDRTLFTLQPAAGGAVDGVLAVVNAASISLLWNRAECVLKQMPQETEAVSGFTFMSFDTYELLGNGATSYTNVVEIDGRAEQALIMPVDAATGLDAKLTGFTDFRLALNNVDLTDTRSVVPYSSLYYDRLVDGMEQANYTVKNLQNPLYDITQAEMYSADRTEIISMPLFKTANRKNLQININSAGLTQYVLFTPIKIAVDL
jgi:hypothetical protein